MKHSHEWLNAAIDKAERLSKQHLYTAKCERDLWFRWRERADLWKRERDSLAKPPDKGV